MISKFFRRMSRILRPIAYVFGYFIPIQNNKIVIENYGGKGYGDNAKYIVNQLLAKNTNVRIIWILKNAEDAKDLPEGVEYCLDKTISSAYHLRTAKVWIDNCRKAFPYKREKQFYLQTWHGFALKRIEKDASDNLTKGYVRGAIRDSKHISLIVSCSRFMTEIYKKSFWYDGEVVELGAPRNDIIIRNNVEVRNKVINRFGISDKRGIILYAPTFRVDKSLESYSLDYNMIRKVCEQKFGKDFAIFVRLHPSMSNRTLNVEFNNDIFNATKYNDMQELLCAADIVITDYSSLMFDFALSKKPVFLFATDINNYRNDRNFYFDLESLPFTIAQTNNELMSNIIDFNDSKYSKDVSNFFERVGMIRDGNAAEKCAELICNVIYESKLL